MSRVKVPVLGQAERSITRMSAELKAQEFPSPFKLISLPIPGTSRVSNMVATFTEPWMFLYVYYPERKEVRFQMRFRCTTSGTATSSIAIPLPIRPSILFPEEQTLYGRVVDTANGPGFMEIRASDQIARVFKEDTSNFGLAAGKGGWFGGSYFTD